MITNDDILSWINDMPLWFRKATSLYYQNDVVTDSDIKTLTDLCFQEDDTYVLTGLNLVNHGDRIGFSIKSIDEVVGVNAIDSKRPLVFQKDGINVVYGMNGAGKSGYIRILKMVAGAKYREEIKQNIYSGTTVQPKAKVILVDENNNEMPYACNLRKPGQYEVLRNIDIFDTKISNAYVNEAKEANYEPWIFRYFAEIANVANRVKNELKNRQKMINIEVCTFPEELKATQSYGLIQNLSWESDLTLFPVEWTDEQENQLSELIKKNQIEIVNSQMKKYRLEIKNIELLETYFNLFVSYFDDSSWNEILNARSKWLSSLSEKKAAELLFKENASEIDAQSVEIDSWKQLWRYAREYYDQILKSEEHRFATIGEKCPLCNQVITEKSIESRMLCIDEYVNGKVINRQESDYRKYKSLVDKFPDMKTDEEILLLLESANIMDLEDDIKEVIQELKSYVESIKKLDSGIELHSVSLLDICEKLADYKKEINNKIEELVPLIESDEQKEIDLQIKEMQAQKQLVLLNSIIINNVEKMKQIHEIDLVIKKTNTNKVTKKSKELAEEIITSEYVDRFDSELQELAKNSLEVKLIQQKAGSGRIPYKVALCDIEGNQISPQDILSEGENRVTSLAAFFAESSGRSENTPLVVDDPISSLDYTYESKVIERLVKAAEHRQVIVFTHRISMVVGLNEEARKRNIDYKEISLLSSKHKKGVPSEFSNIGGKAKGQLNKLISENLAKIKKTDEFSEEYKSLFHNTCQDFRNVVEKSVEDHLICGVVKRFRRDIQTKNILNNLANITQEECDLINRLMTRYSYYDHSMSDETPLQEFTLEELENDLNELKEWLDTK